MYCISFFVGTKCYWLYHTLPGEQDSASVLVPISVNTVPPWFIHHVLFEAVDATFSSLMTAVVCESFHSLSSFRPRAHLEVYTNLPFRIIPLCSNHQRVLIEFVLPISCRRSWELYDSYEILPLRGRVPAHATSPCVWRRHFPQKYSQWDCKFKLAQQNIAVGVGICWRHHVRRQLELKSPESRNLDVFSFRTIHIRNWKYPSPSLHFGRVFSLIVGCLHVQYITFDRSSTVVSIPRSVTD